MVYRRTNGNIESHVVIFDLFLGEASLILTLAFLVHSYRLFERSRFFGAQRRRRQQQEGRRIIDFVCQGFSDLIKICIHVGVEKPNDNSSRPDPIVFGGRHGAVGGCWCVHVSVSGCVCAWEEGAGFVSASPWECQSQCWCDEGVRNLR